MIFTTLNRCLLISLCLAWVSAPATAQEEEPVDPYVMSNSNAGADPIENERVFQAFNGKQGIENIVNDLIDRSTTNPRIEGIFRATDLVRLRRTLIEQFCYLLGGPCDYTGRTMADSHEDVGLNIMEFNALVEDLQWAMDKEGVPYRMQNKLIAILAPMKKDVVTR